MSSDKKADNKQSSSAQLVWAKAPAGDGGARVRIRAPMVDVLLSKLAGKLVVPTGMVRLEQEVSPGPYIWFACIPDAGKMIEPDAALRSAQASMDELKVGPTLQAPRIVHLETYGVYCAVSRVHWPELECIHKRFADDIGVALPFCLWIELCRLKTIGPKAIDCAR